VNGKGRGPERGRNLALYRKNHDAINWRRPTAPAQQVHTDLKKEASRLHCRRQKPDNSEQSSDSQTNS